MSLRISGLDDLKRRLDRFGKRLSNDDIEDAMVDALEPARKAMISAAPSGETDPGDAKLKRSMIVYRAKPTRGGPRVLVGPSKDAFHGFFVEFGTSRAAPRPFARSAFNGTKGEVMSILEKEIGSQIRKITAQVGVG